MESTQNHLTDAIVKRLPAPAQWYRIVGDATVKGFGVRVTARGVRAFVLEYRTRGGRKRRYTIGRFPDWTTAAAREEAADLKAAIRGGDDPLGRMQSDRAAPTVKDLAERFAEEHLPRKRPATRRDYQSIIERDLLPVLRHMKVADVTHSDVDRLHRTITRRAPYRANRAVAVLSKMMSLAIRSGWRGDNPCRGLERNPEAQRRRYLSGPELARLTKALAEHPDQEAANIIRLLLLTGARKGEVLAATWDQFDLADGRWTKPAATTKQKEEHRVPLSAPARLLLAELRDRHDAQLELPIGGTSYVFPGRAGVGHRDDVKAAWAGICKSAKLAGVRIHDLRHTYASVLASAGFTLPMIGALLGHTQPATTARYAHLFDDPLRAATERAGAIIGGAGEGDESDGELINESGR